MATLPVGERRQASCLDIDPKIGGMNAAWPVADGVAENAKGFCGNCAMFFRSAGHGIDFTVEKLVLGGALQFEGDIVAIRSIPVKTSSRRHRLTSPRHSTPSVSSLNPLLRTRFAQDNALRSVERA